MSGDHRTPYLFVSYASADRERVLPVVERLEAAGVQTWVDREGIHGGANYALEIAEAIEHAAALLLMCSAASLASRNVKQELALGWRFEKTYLPLLLEPVEIPKDVAYWLEGSQWIELLDRPEHDWLPDVARALQPLGVPMRLLAPAAQAEQRARPLLVGREREQGQLREQLDRMLQGRGSLVLVGGEAGIGKTTLLEDLAAQAEVRGALVLWGHAYDLSVTPPYGPWLEILAAYPQRAGLPPLPPYVGSLEATAALGSQERLFAATGAFLRGVAAEKALLLVLDDLQWADQASLDFLRFLARQVAGDRLLLLASYRSDELNRRHPLYALLPFLVREAGATLLELRPLDDQGDRALIQARYALADTDLDRLLRYLRQHAEGNPLYAGELLQTLADEGVLARRDDAWSLGDLERVRVPPLLRQVIEGRLRQLGENARAQLAVAAVIGQEVPLALWQEVSGASDEALAVAVEEGQKVNLIEEVAAGTRYRFRHALLREVLYEDLIALRRRIWHRKVAEVLAASPSPDPDQVAHHFMQAWDSRAVAWLVRAGARAQSAYAWPTAVARFEAALAKLTEQGAPAGERVVLLYRIAYLQRYRDSRRALTMLAEARRLADEAGETGLASRCLAISGLIQFFQGNVREGTAALERAVAGLKSLSTDEQQRVASLVGNDTDTLEGTFILCLAAAGRLQEAVALGEQLIAEIAPPPLVPGQSGSGYADGLQGLAHAMALQGQPDRARVQAQRAREIYQQVEHHAMVAWLDRFELEVVQLPYFADELEARAGLATAAEEAARRAVGAIPESLSPRYVTLALRVLEGAWQEARTVAQASYGPLIWQFRVYGGLWLATLAHRQGDAALAWQVIGELLPNGSRTRPGNTFLAAALPLQRLAAELALDARDLPAARGWLRAHDRWLVWSKATLGRTEGALLWSRYHHAEGEHALARQQAELALADASNPRQPPALLAAHRVLGFLDTQAQDLDAADEHLKKSLALAQACAAPFERALTLIELGRLRVAQGKPDEARALLAEARALCEPLGAKPTLERIVSLEQQIASGGVDA